MPSPDAPLRGSCSCGAVRFEVTAPFTTAGYCHCSRCRRRTGAMWSLNAAVGVEGFAILEGAEEVRTWRPEGGAPKSFCRTCGGHLFSGEPGTGPIGVRLGTVDGDPGIRPRWHQWLEAAPEWEPIPDDGLPRFPRAREAG
jgi:hypothetical protein